MQKFYKGSKVYSSLLPFSYINSQFLTCDKNYKNWHKCIKVIASQIWDIF